MFYDAQQRPSSPRRALCAPSSCAARYGARAWTAASKSGATTGPRASSAAGSPPRCRAAGWSASWPTGWPRTRRPVALGPAARANLCVLRRHLLRDPATLRRRAQGTRLVTDPDHDAGPPAPARHLPRARRLPCPAGSAQEDPFFDEPLPFLGGQRARLPWRDLARKIRAQAPHRQATFAQEVINGELDNVLAYGGTCAPLSLTPNACWPCAPEVTPMNRRPGSPSAGPPIC